MLLIGSGLEVGVLIGWWWILVWKEWDGMLFFFLGKRGYFGFFNLFLEVFKR